MNRNKIMKEYNENLTSIDDKMSDIKEKLDSLRVNLKTLRYNRAIKNYLLKELNLTEILIKEVVELKIKGDIILNDLSKTDFVLPLIK